MKSLENNIEKNIGVKYTCALCKIHACNTGELDKAPKNCPCKNEMQESIKELYKEEENYKIANKSALVVMDNYGMKTRLQETIEFAKECGYKKIGIAFCIGLSKEARVLSNVLTYHGFTVNSVICKNGSVSREFIDIKGSTVPMCNPIGQAKLLNDINTDLNIILGLCVGHDSLFIKYSKAPVTVFAVKDRVLCHNPLGAIYQAESYYKEKLFPEKVLSKPEV